jgi:low temperature requirement protein LtrA
MATMTEAAEPQSKKVSWVEAYFDLVFAFVVARLAVAIAGHPDNSDIWSAVGLFVILWWTWIGFAVLYNRHGTDGRTRERLTLLLGTVPCAVLGAQVNGALDGDFAYFGCALVASRLLLTAAHYLESDRSLRPSRRSVWQGYAISSVLFGIATAWSAGGGWTTALIWFALIQESARLLSPQPSGSVAKIDPGHLAERFGLFMIILLGETVSASAGDELDAHSAGYWLGLIGGLVLGATLWWIYFDRIAEFNEHRLAEAAPESVGKLARDLYGGSHLLPAFALLLVAAGLDLSLAEKPEDSGAWLLSAGVALYVLGNGRFLSQGREQGTRRPWRRWLSVLIAIATVALAKLTVSGGPVSPGAFVAVLAVWTILTAVRLDRRLTRIQPTAA